MSRMVKQVGSLDEGESNLMKLAMQRSGQLRGVSHSSRNQRDVSKLYTGMPTVTGVVNVCMTIVEPDGIAETSLFSTNATLHRELTLRHIGRS